jgi:hypothetical protein
MIRPVTQQLQHTGGFDSQQRCRRWLESGHRWRVSTVGILLALPFCAGNRVAKHPNAGPPDAVRSGYHGALPNLAKLPQLQVNVLMPNTTGYLTINMRAGADLQKAINSTSCNPHGTTLQLQHGNQHAPASVVVIGVTNYRLMFLGNQSVGGLGNLSRCHRGDRGWKLPGTSEHGVEGYCS